MVASNCFNLLSSIVNSFGSVDKIQTNSSYQDIPVGQGLRIFAFVATRSTQSKSFFRNQIVNSYIFNYKVTYSLDEFKMQAEQSLVAQYERTLDALNLASQRNFDRYKNENSTIEQYLNTADMLAAKTKEVKREIEEINKDNLPHLIEFWNKQLIWHKRQQVDYGFRNEFMKYIEGPIKELNHSISESQSKSRKSNAA